MRISPTPAKKLAEMISARIIGETEQSVTGFSEIHRVQKGDCIFVDHPKYYDNALNSAATTIIINREVEAPRGKTLLIHEDPFSAFNQLTKHFSPSQFSNVHIAATAKIGPGTRIMPGCFIGEHVVIGNNCLLHPNVVVYHNCSIGSNTVIHANTSVGSDAFYFKKRSDRFEPLYSCGNVEIGDDVVIGANCTIDRGVTDTTSIGNGSVLDNQVHVGHDVAIGKMCLFAAQVGIAGACNIGDNVTVWGQVGISSAITIGNGATILAQSGVGENVPANRTFFGSPAGEARQKMREVFATKQLPDLIGKLYGDNNK